MVADMRPSWIRLYKPKTSAAHLCVRTTCTTIVVHRGVSSGELSVPQVLERSALITLITACGAVSMIPQGHSSNGVGANP